MGAKVTVQTKRRQYKKTEKGMAIMEAIPVLFMLVLVFNFSLGFFGAVHSGILNSIASYNYTLETFRFKSNLVYFRPGGGTTNYAKSLNRVHGTVQDGNEVQSAGKEDKNKWPATQRGIMFNYKRDDPTRNLAMVQNGNGKEAVPDGVGDHEWLSRATSTNIWKADSKYSPQAGDAIQTPRIWIKTVYGICINTECSK
jgi:hypothetical protein